MNDKNKKRVRQLVRNSSSEQKYEIEDEIEDEIADDIVNNDRWLARTPNSEGKKRSVKRRLLIQIGLLGICILILLIFWGEQKSETLSLKTTNTNAINNMLILTGKLTRETSITLDTHKDTLQKLRMHNVLRDTLSKKEGETSFVTSGNVSGGTRNQSGDYNTLVKRWENEFLSGTTSY